MRAGGRGISQTAGGDGEEGEKADDLGESWFGGKIDADGRFVRNIHTGASYLPCLLVSWGGWCEVGGA